MPEPILETTAPVTTTAEVSKEAPAPVDTAKAETAPTETSKTVETAPTEAGAKDSKTESPEATKTIVPEKYELKLAKDSLLDAKAIEKTSIYAKEKGLSNEQAQALLDQQSTAVAEHVARQSEALNERQSTWRTAVENDKELGGKAFEESVEFAKRAVKKFGSEALTKELNDTGLGNHPEVVRIFARIGKFMGDDKLVSAPSQITNKKSPAESLYGGSNKEK